MPPHSLNSHTTQPSWACGQRSKIAIIGAGELGLRAAVEFADRGYEVVCADVEGEPVCERAALDELGEGVRRHARAGRLRLTSSSAEAARHGQVVVFAAQREGLEGLTAAAVRVAQNLSGPTVIVDRTTLSEAAADRLARLLARHSEHEIVVVSRSLDEQPAVRVFLRSARAAASLLHRFG